MNEYYFKFHLRLREFVKKLDLKGLTDFRMLLFTPLWIFTFYLVFYPGAADADWWSTIFDIQIILWIMLLLELSKKVQPPVELVIGVLFVIYSFEAVILRYVYANPDPGIIFNLFLHFHIILLAIAMLFIGVLLMINSKRKIGALIVYILISWLAVELVEKGGNLSVTLMEIVLFVFLLHKTTWMERLTKVECWLYLLAGFLMFRGILNWNPLTNAGSQTLIQSHTWYGGPWVLIITLKLYTLAVLVKIPIVLVYNFASLARKLKISSLFQSTFPQLIQATMLILIFYFFIAGWQAEKVRKALFDTITMVASGELAAPEYWVEINPSGFEEIDLPGYLPFKFPGDFPANGILRLAHDSSTEDYFLFAKRKLGKKDRKTERIYFVRMDSSFVQLVAQHTSILAGSKLLAYPYHPTNWESYIYQVSGKIGIFPSNRTFRIFPFGLISTQNDKIVEADLRRHTKEQAPWEIAINRVIRQFNNLAVGRVVAPVLNRRLQQAGFFVFDIWLVPEIGLFSTTLLSYLIILACIYSLVNFSITRRMVKFGEEINYMIVQKFNQLKKGIQEISSGNLDYKVSIEGRDEFVELGDRFNRMGDRLKTSLAEEREKERLEHELAIARQVQLDLLPRSLPEISGFELAATLQTANEVGGDFYDVIPLSAGKYLFTIGDVSGKGTSAAFYMAQFISLLRYSPEFTDRPDEIACHLNRYFSDPSVDKKVFVTAILGIVNAKTGIVKFVRAGHTLPLFVPAEAGKEIHEIKKNGLGIGIERSGELFATTLEVSQITLHPGDAIVFHTDGVEEAACEDGETGTLFYGNERLCTILSEVRGKNAGTMLAGLTGDLAAFYAGTSPVDDYTVLVLKRQQG